jgi:hypothetical protein
MASARNKLMTNTMTGSKSGAVSAIFAARRSPFLPVFSLPYSHYSLIARSEALRRNLVENCSWEEAAPPLKDPHRVPDPSTLRRWFRNLDSAQPPFSFLRRTLAAVDHWLRRDQVHPHGNWSLSWSTIYPLLRRFWPLRI